MNEFNEGIIKEFRENEGRVEMFGDAPMVILHTIGAKSGEVREIPLVSMPVDDEMFIFASAAGAKTNPAWYHNLLATPEVEVEYRTERFRATLTPLDDASRAARLNEQVAIMPQFGEYITDAAPRLIPVFAINRT